jgi:hypothetical protein
MKIKNQKANIKGQKWLGFEDALCGRVTFDICLLPFAF